MRSVGAKQRETGEAGAASGRAVTVVVVGGGNAGLTAALTARESGARVLVLECAPKPFRGGNTRHTRNIRTVHAAGDGYVTGPYLFDEFSSDLAGVTGNGINRALAEITVCQSEAIPDWMRSNGVRWQRSLKGTLGLARTNRFFLGGGKAMLNALYRSAEQSGVAIEYDAQVVDIETDGSRATGVIVTDGGPETRRIAADAVVIAAGGFEANRDWLAEYWGQAAHNFAVRGTPHNDGTVLRILLNHGATTVGDPRGVHAIAVDARAPLNDAGIVSRLDVIPIGIVVNRHGDRFYDEGEDVWPKRYATWGRLIAEQPEQLAFAIYDSKVAGETIPGLYRPMTAATITDLANQLGLPRAALDNTITTFNSACDGGCTLSLAGKDGCSTRGIVPKKSNWAGAIDTPPYFAYPLRTGITFTYLGVAVDQKARVQTRHGYFENIYAAGEIMSGNILTRGYLAGFGLAIGSVWGRIAGNEAAHASRWTDD